MSKRKKMNDQHEQTTNFLSLLYVSLFVWSLWKDCEHVLASCLSLSSLFRWFVLLLYFVHYVTIVRKFHCHIHTYIHLTLLIVDDAWHCFTYTQSFTSIIHLENETRQGCCFDRSPPFRDFDEWIRYDVSDKGDIFQSNV